MDETLRAAIRQRTHGERPHARVMNLDLSDEEGKALACELDAIVRNNRYPLSPRIQLLKAILGQLRPEPVREPLPEPKRYAPPHATAARRRRAAR